MNILNDHKSQSTKGVKYWLFQIVPPLLMLGVLFVTDKGSALVFLAGFYLFPVLFSIISIFAKLFDFRKRKYFLIRPVLTVAVFVSTLIIAHWSYNVALEQAIVEARIIHGQCNKNLLCPKNLINWEREGSRIKKTNLGLWLKYTASYYYKDESFNIRVYQGPDMGDYITGGVNVPFNITRYVED